MKHYFLSPVVTIIFVSFCLSGFIHAQAVDRALFSLTMEKAEAGNESAQVLLALFYAKGEIVPKNERESLRWISRAANQGHLGAQRTMSILYQNNNGGVGEDLVKAYMWAEIAANQTSPPDEAAFRMCFDLKYLMKPEQLADAKAAARTNARAQIVLHGMMGRKVRGPACAGFIP